MVRPVTISMDSYLLEQTKMADLNAKFAGCAADDSLRKLSKKELFKNATLLQTHGSDLMGRVSLSLKTYGEEKVNSEKNDYNSLQRFAFRVAGVFKRGVFATKGEAAIKLSKKITAVQIKVDTIHPGGLMAKIASISVRDFSTDDEKLRGELNKLRDNNFSKLFASHSFSAKDAVNVMQKYENLDDTMTKEKTKAFISEVAKTQPEILVSEEILQTLLHKDVMQNHIADWIVNLSDNNFKMCIENLHKKSGGNAELIVKTNAIVLNTLIMSKAKADQIAMVRKE